MQDEPLSLATLLRYASTFQSDATVSTWTGEGMRSITFGEVGEQAARLANALRGHGVAVLLKVYAHCIDGQADAANQRITDALSTPEAEHDSGDEGDADSEPTA
jgi:hypothetical protein